MTIHSFIHWFVSFAHHLWHIIPDMSSMPTSSSASSKLKQNPDESYHQGVQLYQYGFASGFDAINAANFFEKAVVDSNNTHLDAICKYGECCLWGKGVQQDQKKAYQHFQQAASKGHTLASYYMGYCLLMGSGVSKDATQAQSWFEKAMNAWKTAAHEKKDGEAMYWLGWCNEQSYGMEVPNFEEAVKWYQQAADTGHTNAQYYLAMYLRSSAAHDKEKLAQATQLLEAAAKKNHPAAKKELKKDAGPATAASSTTSPSKMATTHHK